VNFKVDGWEVSVNFTGNLIERDNDDGGFRPPVRDEHSG